jgi:hypothetical protein
MAATVGGALKQLIESAGLGLAAYRDLASPDAVLPYVVITEGIVSETISGGDNGAEDTEKENIQVDLYQAYMDPKTRKVTETTVLVKALKRAMHGKQLTAAPTHVYGVRVPFNTRTRRADDNTVRTRYSVDVHSAF